MTSFVKCSTSFINNESKFVKIKKENINRLAKNILPLLKNYSFDLKQSENISVEWLFYCDLLNFSFWSADEYKVEYQNNLYTGYYSLTACLNKAFGRLNPQSIMNDDHLNNIFDCVIGDYPMKMARVDLLKTSSQILIDEFNGSVESMIIKAEKSASKLIDILLNHFPSFRDISIYNGKQVYFLKRAQIFVADLWFNFKGKGLGEFYDIDDLTMFADYRVPQVLNTFD